MKLFDVNGQTEFPVYDSNGALELKTTSVLVEDRDGVRHLYHFNPRSESLEHAKEKFAEMLAALERNGLDK